MGLEDSLGKEFIGLKVRQRAALKAHEDFMESILKYIPGTKTDAGKKGRRTILQELAELLQAYNPQPKYEAIIADRLEEIDELLMKNYITLAAQQDELMEYLAKPGPELVQAYTSSQNGEIQRGSAEMLKLTTISAFYKTILGKEYNFNLAEETKFIHLKRRISA